jgi:hypothetical protein
MANIAHQPDAFQNNAFQTAFVLESYTTNDTNLPLPINAVLAGEQQDLMGPSAIRDPKMRRTIFNE